MSIKINITSPKKGVSSMPFVTGQTAIWHSGDDGDTQRGRPFFTLPIVGGVQQLNHFGSKWRFTGVTGGYYDRDTLEYKDVNGVITTRSLAYPNELRCDWSTLDWDNNFLLYWIPEWSTLIGNWDYCIEQINSFSSFGFDSFAPLNRRELDALGTFHSFQGYFGIPEILNTTATHNIWSSTTDNYYSTHALYISMDGYVSPYLKDNSGLTMIGGRITNILEV